MKRNYTLFIRDILNSISKIEEFIDNMSYDDFMLDNKTKSAVVREIEIIGEATKNIPDDIKRNFSNVPWREMVRMRDKLIHWYFGINYKVVWRVAKEELPRIKPLIKKLLESLNFGSNPLVSIVIPHYNGEEILKNCFLSLKKCHYKNIEIILVDNASTDKSIEIIEKNFSGKFDIKIIKNDINLGFAGGCNVGIKNSSGKYVLILNNDTEQESDWINYLVEVMESDEKICAVQPKILYIKDKEYFDYSGGAGGGIDIFGFPFALGRVFDTVEKDTGQYNKPQNIFWASGTAMMIKKSVLDKVGLFDEIFFAHMEEIDLCWRMQLAGFKLYSVPKSVVYHYSGYTLPKGSFKKSYLNHRNNLFMLLKNYSFFNLLWIFPARILMQLIALFKFLLDKKFQDAKAVLYSFIWIISHPFLIYKSRRNSQKIRVASDSYIMKEMYKGSIVIDYFLFRREKASEILRKLYKI